MSRCTRCGTPFERFTVDQHRCTACQAAVDALIALDARRNARRTFTARDLTGQIR